MESNGIVDKAKCVTKGSQHGNMFSVKLLKSANMPKNFQKVLKNSHRQDQFLSVSFDLVGVQYVHCQNYLPGW